MTIDKVLLRPYEPLEQDDARRLGYTSVEAARAAWSRQHGHPTSDTAVWVLVVVPGDRTRFYARHAERYLSAKGVGTTTDPARAVRDEGALPHAEQEQLAENAKAERLAAAIEAMAAGLATIKGTIAEMRAHEHSLSASELDDLAWLERRAERMVRRAAPA